nr:TPA_asm: hypothetical protein HUJ06_023459 [Nelumbo nucifera]
MALASTSTLSSKSLLQSQSPLRSSNPQHSSFPLFPNNKSISRSAKPISAVHAAEPAKNPVVADKQSKSAASASTTIPPKTVPGKWTVDSWKSKKALQLPEYPDKQELESVLKTIEAFPPIVFAGEARSLEERLAEAAMGRAFLLQGGDCAESFKEFNANNIRDTFRILLQMGAVLMFGGQMPVVKV